MEYRIKDVFTSILHRPEPAMAGITYMECDAEIALLGNTMEGSTSYYSFNVVCKGSLEVVMGNDIICLKENDLFIYPPGVKFKVRNVSADYYAMSIVAEEFFMQDIPQIRRVIRASYIPILTNRGKSTHLTEDELHAVTSRISDIKRYLTSESTYRMECLQFEYALLIMDVLDIQSRKSESFGRFSENTRSMLIEFLRLLQLNYREHHDIPFYADKLSVTPIYLSRVIKKTTGRTVMSLVNQMLGVEASNLLANTDMPISDIAQKLNFADSATFCKFFTRRTNMSPRQYRKTTHAGT